MTLQSDGSEFTRPTPNGATLALGCDWIGGDSHGLLLLVSRTDGSTPTAALETLADDGFTCEQEQDTVSCRLVEDTPSRTTTVVSRGDIWLYAEANGIDATDLLVDLGTQIWG